MKKLSITTALLALVISMPSWSHVGLKQSVPAKDAMLMQSPGKLSLTFSGNVRLIKLSVSTDDKEPIEFGFKPNVDPAKTYQWSLPRLESGNYGVNWVALGKDGHKMSGQYQFMLHGQGMETADPKKKMSHNEHQH